MPLAFVLINTEPEHTESVLQALRKSDVVKEAYMVYGVYDIVAKVKAETMANLNEIVTWRVRGLDNIRSTIALTVRDKTK